MHVVLMVVAVFSLLLSVLFNIYVAPFAGFCMIAAVLWVVAEHLIER